MAKKLERKQVLLAMRMIEEWKEEIRRVLAYYEKNKTLNGYDTKNWSDSNWEPSEPQVELGPFPRTKMNC